MEEWNNLPDDMRKRLNLVAFKSKLKLLLLESKSSESLLEKPVETGYDTPDVSSSPRGRKWNYTTSITLVSIHEV